EVCTGTPPRLTGEIAEMLAHPIQSRGVPGAGSRHSASDGIAKPSIELIDGTAVKRFLVPAGPPEHWLVVGTPEPRESEPRGATATAARGGQPWLRAGTVVFRHISHRRPARRPSHRRGIQIFAPVAANLKGHLGSARPGKTSPALRPDCSVDVVFCCRRGSQSVVNHRSAAIPISARTAHASPR